MFGCCEHAGMLLLNASGALDPELMERYKQSELDRQSRGLSSNFLTNEEAVAEVVAACTCSCHRNDGTTTLC